MLFEFENKGYKDMIFYLSSCSVQGDCLSLQKWDPSLGLTDVNFKKQNPDLGENP